MNIELTDREVELIQQGLILFRDREMKDYLTGLFPRSRETMFESNALLSKLLKLTTHKGT